MDPYLHCLMIEGMVEKIDHFERLTPIDSVDLIEFVF